MTHPLPNAITDRTYEAIEALRSVLDQIAYPIAVAAKVKRPEQIHFPIADDAAHVETLLAKLTTQGFPTAIVTLFRSCKSYRDGNVTIWALNQIRRQARHRLIVPIGTAVPGTRVNNVMCPFGMVDVLVPAWNREKHELILFRTLPGTKLEYNLDISLSIAFGNVEGVAGDSVIDFLEEAATEVARFFEATENEAGRIGLFR